MGTAVLVIRVALSLVFLVAGAAKLLDLPGARKALVGFGAPHELAGALSLLLPVVEIAIAVALLPSATAWWGALLALLLLLIFIAAIVRSIRRGQAPDCHCFGQLHSAPAGPDTLARNAVLVALAAFVVARGPDGAGTSATAGLGRLNSGELVAVAALAVAAGVAVAASALAVSLLRAHGRLLLRVDELENALASAGIALPTEPGNGNGATAGLPVGSRAPDFEIDDIGGDRYRLRELLSGGLPLMLVFSDPACGPCKQLLPLVADWERVYAAQVQIALVSDGDTDLMRAQQDELGLKRILVQQGHEVASAYACYGTPAAVLISPEGVIASPVKSGPKGVHDLLEQAVGAPVPVPRNKDGGEQVSALPPGAQPPGFELPTVAGGVLSSANLRGTETVLLFWNPGCGFCAKMKPDLQAWWQRRRADEPELVVVSRGSAEENMDLGPPERVVLDQEFWLASSFGATGTPMAVLLDAGGHVGSRLVAGAEPVLALLSGARRTAGAATHG